MIDYSLLGEASTYYTNNGFQRLELPWFATYTALCATDPKESKLIQYYSQPHYLVASGEQSFLDYILSYKFQQEIEINKKKGNLTPIPKGSFFCITPCFRDEETPDDLTRPYFIKLEIFENLDVSTRRLLEIINVCYKWFAQHITCKIIETDLQYTDRVASGPSYDIVSKGKKIELGSYGIRQFNGVEWMYATGCAEPRLTTAIKYEASDANA